MKLLTFMAKACFYAQEHVDDGQAWPLDEVHREQYFCCVSFQMACFLAQNTVRGHEGVEWEVVIDELTEHPMKTERQWRTILDRIAKKQLGGWVRQ